MLPLMSGENFKVVFNGPSVSGGDIDVRDLAPALLALGDVFRSASEAINGGKVETSVKVRATTHACFEVDLTVTQSAYEYAKYILSFASENKEQIADAKALAELILAGSSIVGAPIVGLFYLLKFLRSRRPDKVVSFRHGVQVQIGDNYVFVDPRTLLLAEDINVRTNLKKFTSCIRPGHIEEVSAVHSDSKVNITIADTASFDLPEPKDEELSDEVRRMNLQIISLSFKDDNKWKVTDGAEPFSASIEDNDFQKKIDNSEVSFAKGDYLVCDVREKQSIISGVLKKDRTIIRVLDHKPSPRQMKLL